MRSLLKVLTLGYCCRGRIAQQGEPGQLARNPMSPFVMHFIGDVNQMPSDCKFVRKMGFQTDKPFAMCRPADVSLLPFTTLLVSLGRSPGFQALSPWRAMFALQQCCLHQQWVGFYSAGISKLLCCHVRCLEGSVGKVEAQELEA